MLRPKSLLVAGANAAKKTVVIWIATPPVSWVLKRKRITRGNLAKKFQKTVKPVVQKSLQSFVKKLLNLFIQKPLNLFIQKTVKKLLQPFCKKLVKESNNKLVYKL
jgi:hypothetical protein